MPPSRRAQKRKAQALRGPLASIAEESAPMTWEESGVATREELPAPTSREERLAHRLARQKDFNSSPGSSAMALEFQRSLSSTKAAWGQFEADLAKLRGIEAGRTTTPAVQETPPAPQNRTPATAMPFPLIPIPIPPPSVVQQIERAVSAGWIPYYSVAPSGDSSEAVAKIIPHVYIPWPASPSRPPPKLDADGEGGDGHYYYPYFALPAERR